MKRVILSIVGLIGAIFIALIKSKEKKGSEIVGQKIKNNFSCSDYVTKSRILANLDARTRKATRPSN